MSVATATGVTVVLDFEFTVPHTLGGKPCVDRVRGTATVSEEDGRPALKGWSIKSIERVFENHPLGESIALQGGDFVCAELSITNKIKIGEISLLRLMEVETR